MIILINQIYLVKKMNIPNLLSISRIVLAILLVLFITNSKLALLIFLLAALTDYLDGYLARKLNQETKLGLILDPLADKILVITTLLLLIISYKHPYWYLLILIRDLNNITMLPLLAKLKNKSTELPLKPLFLGKLTTVFQKISIIFILLNYNDLPFIIITIVLSFLSAVDYNSRI